jgi:hypothetical protein
MASKTKVCPRCKEQKPVADFGKHRNNKDGLQNWCKACKKQQYEATREKTAAQMRTYQQEHREEIAAYQKAWREANSKELGDKKRAYYETTREAHAARSKAYREANAEELARKKKKYYQANREELAVKTKAYRKATRAKRNAREANKRRTDVEYKLRVYLRTRLNKALKRDSKVGSAVRDLGCSIAELRAHLESQFNSQMNWRNWGKYWEVDHVYPLDSANLKDRSEFLAVNNWRNLRPLTKVANAKKGNRVTLKAKRLFIELLNEFRKSSQE